MRFLARKITDLHGPFSSMPCLITGGYNLLFVRFPSPRVLRLIPSPKGDGFDAPRHGKLGHLALPFRAPFFGTRASVKKRISLGAERACYKPCLVGGDWNMPFIFPYIGDNHPN